MRKASLAGSAWALTREAAARAQGVMLTHANLMYQVTNLSFFLRPAPGERTLSLLPPWHIYERAAGYFCFACGVTQARAASPPSSVVCSDTKRALC